LHAVASVLLFGLLRALDFGRAVAALGATAFAVHPALAAAVAWVPGRNDVLLAVFALGAWRLLLRAARRPSAGALGGHLVCFALALATKETALVLPVVFATQVALLDPVQRARLRPKGYGGALWLGWVVLWGARLAVQRALHLGSLASAVGDFDGRRAPWLVIATFGQLALPVDPSLLGVASDAPVARGALVLGGIAIAAWGARGVRPSVVVLGVASAVLLALPAAATGGEVVLGHRLYLPACGLVIAASELARPLRDRHAAIAFALAAIGALAVMGAGYEATFRDRRHFARAAVLGAPRSALAHFCLGQSYQVDGDGDRALAEYEEALRLGPVDVVHNNIAVIFMARGRWADAERELDEEIAQNPRYARAYANLGVVLRHEGREGAADVAASQARALREAEQGGTTP